MLCCLGIFLALGELRDLSGSEAADTDWVSFVERFDKKYSEGEARVRRRIFRENYGMIREHNIKDSLGLVSYSLQVNEFADLMDHEFKTLQAGNGMTGGTKSGNFAVDIPDRVDWRRRQVVTPVKRQGRCHSCYAFSATGCLEGQYALKHKKLVSLSEQNIVDCSRDFGNMGCGGGYINAAFDYVRHLGGVDREEDYPYAGREQTCKYGGNRLPVRGINNVEKSNETALKYAVAVVGPISAGIHATSHFTFYRGGILDDPGCSPGKLNHGVLVVGYGRQNGRDYWLVKNSWGTWWGERGYVRMSRSRNCGIAEMASYPVL